MATIRQYYKREEDQLLQKSRPLRSTVRFNKLPQIKKGPLAHGPVEPSDVESQYVIDASDYIEDVLALGKAVDAVDEVISTPRGNGECFLVKVSDGISLSSTMLIGMISDRPAANSKASHPPELPSVEHLPPTKRQKVDFKEVAF
ncbi:hypothetical protein FRC12_016912 [Ceratobasidium sp. 428]|nr:hypothetical protein FRC12_016912 [Ceratobasidium sp. 428]